MIVSRVGPAEILPTLAGLYGAAPEDLAWMVDTCTAAWVVHSSGGEVLGAVATRPSPQHGAELMGGAFPGPLQAQAALALAQAAHAEVGRVYAFADGALFPMPELIQAGFREVGAYRRLGGRLSALKVEPPAGLELRRFADVPNPARVQAMQTYEDRIGHHKVTLEAAASDFGGVDPNLSLIALDADGQGVGICCVNVHENDVLVGSPGVAPAWRTGNLRGALLSAVGQALRARGMMQVSMDSWGDTPAELAHDLRLGLHITDETPILALS